MANERLRTAMAAAEIDVLTLAREVAVDPKTVQRWLSGRVPHPRHRWAVARILRGDETHLWPHGRHDLPPGGEATGEVLTAYGHRADVPAARWSEQLASARRRIDLLGYALLFLPEAHPRLTELLRSRAAEGCHVRIALGDPASPDVLARDAEEGLGGSLPARIRTSLLYFDDLFDCERVDIHFHATPLYNSIFRFDEEMFVTPHLFSAPGYTAPLLHLRRLGPEGLFEAFAQHFERVWARSRPADRP